MVCANPIDNSIASCHGLGVTLVRLPMGDICIAIRSKNIEKRWPSITHFLVRYVLANAVVMLSSARKRLRHLKTSVRYLCATWQWLNLKNLIGPTCCGPGALWLVMMLFDELSIQQNSLAS